MKKLIAALALCIGTAAFAQDAKPQDPNAPSQKQLPQKEVETGIDATEVGPGIGGAAKSTLGIQTEDEGTFKKEHAMNLRGTMKDATADGVSIERKGLPVADLDVREKTVVMLDGKKVKADEIPEGADVRAKFQLEGQEAVAVELRATSPKGAKKDMKKQQKKQEPATGGSGSQEMKEDANKAADEANKAADKAEQKGQELKDEANKELNQ